MKNYQGRNLPFCEEICRFTTDGIDSCARTGGYICHESGACQNRCLDAGCYCRTFSGGSTCSPDFLCENSECVARAGGGADAGAIVGIAITVVVVVAGVGGKTSHQIIFLPSRP